MRRGYLGQRQGKESEDALCCNRKIEAKEKKKKAEYKFYLTIQIWTGVSTFKK
jgi:hypothetical protein